jgi:hypothetical protein
VVAVDDVADADDNDTPFALADESASTTLFRGCKLGDPSDPVDPVFGRHCPVVDE